MAVNACPAWVGAQLFVTGACFCGRASASGQIEDTQDAHAFVQRKGDGVADTNQFARFGDSFPVDAHVTGVDEPLREAAAFHQPDTVQITINAQSLTLEVGERGDGFAGTLVC